jgi:hypothetical protein
MPRRRFYKNWKNTFVEFDKLILASQDEAEIQKFMIANTEYIPVFIELHHRIFHNVAFSKLPLGNYISDFCYITKHSEEVRVVFVEIERADKKLFKARKGTYPQITADLSNALDQVRAWKSEVEKAHVRAELIDYLNGLLWYVTKDRARLTFDFILVCGRRGSQQHEKAIQQLSEESGILIKNYDSIRDAVASGRVEKRFLVSRRGNALSVLNFDAMPDSIWDSVPFSRILLTPEHIKAFSDCDIPIQHWMQGTGAPLRLVRAGYYEDNFDKQFDKIEATGDVDLGTNEFTIG